MAAVLEDACGKLTRKRPREELQSDSCMYEAFSVAERATSDAEYARTTPSQVSRMSGLGFASEAVKLLRSGREEGFYPASAILDSQPGYFPGSTVEDWFVPSHEVGDSGTTSCASYETFADLWSSVDGIPDELYPSLGENTCPGISSTLEDIIGGDDTQVTINSLLGDWNEDVGALFPNLPDSYADTNCEFTSYLVACSDTSSSPCSEAWRFAEEHCFLGDSEFDTKAYLAETSNQEQAMTVSSLDRVTDISETEASLFHFLEASAGM